jgi:YidC/Oxa1 family membrane protein insertase
MRAFFRVIIYKPLYNALIALIALMPGHNAGLAVVLLTVMIRLLLFPLSRKAIKTQIEMRKIEPEVQKLRATVKDRQEQAKQLMQLYRDKDINPFASLLLMLIQLPILIGLYSVFRSGLPTINPDLLYGFFQIPAFVDMTFFGINLAEKSLWLAIFSVITQYIQINLALPKSVKKQNSTFQDDLAHNLNLQMRYISPLIFFPISYFSAVVALYFITSNILMTIQELVIKRKLLRESNLV